jgi:hypothetical protein
VEVLRRAEQEGISAQIAAERVVEARLDISATEDWGSPD